MSFVGQKNIYTCDLCGGSVVTINRDEGTTPFLITCRANLEDMALLADEDKLPLHRLRTLEGFRKCTGMMQSSFYSVKSVLIPLKPVLEWYKPGTKEYKKLSKSMREDHVDKGGLLLRPIK